MTTTIPQRRLGATNLRVSALGFGAGPLGDEAAISDKVATQLVRTAIDRGINVIDTAPSYGASETRIGKVVGSLTSARRDEVVLITKGGYGVAGVADWTPDVLSRGIDQALKRLETDHLDVFLLHSCPEDRLARGDLIAPLEHAKKAGKVRAFGYSGDGAALRWALTCDAFDVVECSVNLVDQEALGVVAGSDKGILAKRSLAGAPWSDPTSAYADRFQAFISDSSSSSSSSTSLLGGDWDDLALRFAAFAPHVSSALFGTRRSSNLLRAVECVSRGPLPNDVISAIRERFHADWHGII